MTLTSDNPEREPPSSLQGEERRDHKLSLDGRHSRNMPKALVTDLPSERLPNDGHPLSPPRSRYQSGATQASPRFDRSHHASPLTSNSSNQEQSPPGYAEDGDISSGEDGLEMGSERDLSLRPSAETAGQLHVEAECNPPLLVRRRFLSVAGNRATVDDPQLHFESAPPVSPLPKVPWTPSREEHVKIFLKDLGTYMFDVLGSLIRVLRTPIKYGIILCVLLWVLHYCIYYIIAPIFRPLCFLPGISGTLLCGYTPSRDIQQPHFPKLIEIQTTTIDQLVGEALGGSELALYLTKAEMATSDLITAVRISDLKSRDTLASTLSQFVRDASRTGDELQELNAQVLGAVDRISHINDWALHSIESSSLKPSGLSLWSYSKPGMIEVVTETFRETMTVQSSILDKLILKATLSLKNLDRLKETLDQIYAIVYREDKTISKEQAELLSTLWSKLGGNVKDKERFNDNLRLLKHLSMYREQARLHVEAALTTLKGMRAEMKVLRETVSKPVIEDSRIPVQVQMKSIRSGLEKLQAGKIKARKREDEIIRRILAGN